MHPGAILTLFLRCFLVIGLAFAPVANAMNMAQMAFSQTDTPPCHSPAEQPSSSQDQSDGACGAGHCHCAMSTALPLPILGQALTPRQTSHPQTASRLALGQTGTPEIPPPRTLS